MSLLTYEARIKKYILMDTKINLSQLRAAFRKDPKWNEQLADKSSPFYILLNSIKIGKNQEGAHEYNFIDLWILGLLHCHADIQTKANSFYEIALPDLQQSIDSNNQKLQTLISKLIEFSSTLVYQYVQAKK